MVLTVLYNINLVRGKVGIYKQNKSKSVLNQYHPKWWVNTYSVTSDIRFPNNNPADWPIMLSWLNMFVESSGGGGGGKIDPGIKPTKLHNQFSTTSKPSKVSEWYEGTQNIAIIDPDGRNVKSIRPKEMRN